LDNKVFDVIDARCNCEEHIAFIVKCCLFLDLGDYWHKTRTTFS